MGSRAVIVLDTHALVWWVTGDVLLSEPARAAIEHEQVGGDIIVSAITAWEIAMLVAHKRLVLSMDVDSWLSAVAEIEAVQFLAVDVELAMKSVVLPGAFHKDPAYRMIVATARKLAAPLVTKDDKLREYPHVRTIW